jgi:long-chain fatty acid transport protein
VTLLMALTAAAEKGPFMKRLLLSATALALIGQVACSHNAIAAAFMVRENSAEALGTIFAGNGSRADEASTVFNNPAGMTRLAGSEVEVGTAVLFPSIKFNGSSSVLGTPLPGDNGGNGGETSVIPHLYGKFDITDRLKFGLAVTVPFGNAVNYDSTSAWSGRYVGIKTAALSADINPNIAYQLNEHVSIGAGVSAQYFKLDVSSAIPQFLIFGPTAPDAIYHLKASDWDYGFNLGMLADLDPATRIGLTYRSKVDHRVKGTLNFTAANPLLGVVSGPATADASLPATTGVSLTHDYTPDFEVSADVQFTQWSTFDQVIVQSANGPFPFIEKYKDSWMVSAGAVYHLSPEWTLRGGVGWDQTPISDPYRGVGVPDTDRYMIGLGFGYRFNDTTSLDGAVSRYLASEHASMNTSLSNTDPFTHAVVLQGNYTNHLDYVALTLRHRL